VVLRVTLTLDMLVESSKGPYVRESTRKNSEDEGGEENPWQAMTALVFQITAVEA
jgi:hypothetical protein